MPNPTDNAPNDDLCAALADILSRVQRPGDFYANGSRIVPIPRLIVEGVGPLSFPLPESQARQLLAVADPAPYGRGGQTLVDKKVRRAWQIAPRQIRLEDPHWTRTLEQIVAEVSDGLGAQGEVRAELYKLLLYDKGSFFVDHRDTEKEPGMFATLVVVLPSLHEGGELVVRHGGREVSLPLSGGEPSEVAYAAFYADCVHELRPITSGYRLSLIYNLVRSKAKEPLKAPDYRREQREIAALLRQWDESGEGPLKVLYALEHRYTPAELSFAGLKGADAAAALALESAAAETDCELHLAMISIHESGSAEHVYRGRGRRRWYEDNEDDEDFEVVEVHDRTEEIGSWILPDGEPAGLGPIPFEEDEVSPPGALEDAEPDEQCFTEATGNEGASFERTYRRAALTLWPRRSFPLVLGEAKTGTYLPYLRWLAAEWSAAGLSQDHPLWQEAHDLAQAAIENWPGPYDPTWPRPDPPPRASLLTALAQLRNGALIERFLAEVLEESGPAEEEAEALADCAEVLGWEKGAAALPKLLRKHMSLLAEACVAVLERLAARFRATKAARALLRDCAAEVVGALPGDPAQVAHLRPWEGPRGVKSDLVVRLFAALWRVGDDALTAQATETVLARRDTYGLDAVLVPAVRALYDQIAAEAASQESFQRLRRACTDHLRARIALPLEAPRDWTRPNQVSCSCADCTEMATFLTDPSQPRWLFRAAEHRRRHITDRIHRDMLDLDHTTERRGSPHTLICTKNQGSYERRLQQRAEDTAALAHLAQAEPPGETR